MTLTKYGIREWGSSGIAALALIGGFVALALTLAPVTGWILAGFTAVCWLALAAFFRNPARRLPDGDGLLSPADGVIKDIETIQDCGIDCFVGRDVLRIGIFLSVLDVHLNRAPGNLEVTCKHYREGRYLDARHQDCHKENEAMTIGGQATVGDKCFPLAVRQISGAIARRIVCQVEPGQKLYRGEIYGMIKFGSRTELYLPADEKFELKVNIGDRVNAGATVMAELKR